jgi:hypothetical protein
LRLPRRLAIRTLDDLTRPMSLENRASRRHVVMTRGIVHSGPDQALQRCLVRNVSATGAKLRLPTTKDVPERFTLILSRDGTVKRECCIVWRSDQEVGVRFVRSGDEPRMEQ